MISEPLDFISPRWLPGGHLQTIYPATIGKKYLKKFYCIKYSRETWSTPDDDFIEIDWLKKNDTNKPLLVLFHGLEGSSDSYYSILYANIALTRGWKFAVVHFRGCSGKINLAPRSYHAGDSNEIDWIIKRFNNHCIRFKSELFAIGISLGGNVLLKWAGEKSKKTNIFPNKLRAITAVAVPLDLQSSSFAINRGLNKYLYANIFLKTMIKKAKAKWQQYPNLFNLQKTISSKTILEFDEHYTAPVHMFKSVKEYLVTSSSINYVNEITIPTLIVNSQNDPIVPFKKLSNSKINNNFISLWHPNCGGHAGYVSKKISNEPSNLIFFYFPNCIFNWLSKYIKRK